MFDLLFPKWWSTLKKLIWLKAAALSSAVVKTVTAAIVHIRDALAGPAQNVTIAIEPVQAGTGDPSPDNVRPITGWTGANVWNDPKYGGLIRWNQLVSFGQSSRQNNSVTYSFNADGTVSLSGTATGNSYANFSPISGVENHVLLIKGCPSGGSSQTYYLRDGYTGEILSRDTGNGVILIGKANFTCQILVNTGVDATGLIFKPQVFDLTEMFGAGNEPTTVDAFRALFSKDYYPYNAGEVTTVSAVNGDPYRHIPITFPTPPGTVYGGTLDVTTGELTVDRAGKFFDGTETGWLRSGTYNGSFYITTGMAFIQNPTSNTAICSHAVKASPFPSGYAYGKFGFDGNNSNANFNVWIMPADSTVQDFKDYLSACAADGEPLGFVCELATPQTYQLAAHQIDLLAGENSLWSDTGNTTLTYLADGRADDVEALNILLGGRYHNSGAADEATDKEALEILLGGTK